MNIDIVTSDRQEDMDTLVNYGEPSPSAVYRAAFGIEPGASADLNLIKTIVEELDEVYWEVLSIEHGEERQPASFWQCSNSIGYLSTQELHQEYEICLRMIREEYYKISISLVADDL